MQRAAERSTSDAESAAASHKAAADAASAALKTLAADAKEAGRPVVVLDVGPEATLWATEGPRAALIASCLLA